MAAKLCGEKICVACRDPIDKVEFKGRRVKPDIAERLHLHLLREPPWIHEKCRLSILHAEEWNCLCMGCLKWVEKGTFRGVSEDMIPFFTQKKCPLITKCCSRCHSDATQFVQTGRKRDRESFEGKDGRHWNGTDGRRKRTKSESAHIPTKEAMIRGLRSRAQMALQNPYPGNALTHPMEYQEHMNAKADGIVDILRLGFSPSDEPRDRWAVNKTVFRLEGFLHQANRKYSKSQWFVSTLLSQQGVSRRNRVGWCHSGVGMYPSNQSIHDAALIADRDAEIDRVLMDPNVELIGMYDDMNSVHIALMPSATGGKAVAARVGNVCMKNVSRLGLDLRVERVGESLLPEKFTFDIAVPFFMRNFGSALIGVYMKERSKDMQVWSRIVRPYGGPPVKNPDSPVSLDNVFLLLSSDTGFYSSSTIRQVIMEAGARLQGYLSSKLLITTGDFYAFWGAFELARTASGDNAYLRHLVPLPGVFHMGLNAQEAVFTIFKDILSTLCGDVFGRPMLSLPLKPLHRKYFLDLITVGWRLCRREVLRNIETAAVGSVDIIVLLNLFEEIVPVAVDIYSAYLAGDVPLFESLLMRSLRVFSQLGKERYVNCLLLYIMITEHWRSSHPEVYEKYTGSLSSFGEEEIELFHANVRPCTSRVRSSKQLARAITLHGATEAQKQEWLDVMGVPPAAGGHCREHIPDLDVKMKQSISKLFAHALECRSPTARAQEDAEGWVSPTLGKLNDRVFPIPLQRCTHLYKLPTVDVSKFKMQNEGWLSFRDIAVCGHPRGRTRDGCTECGKMLTYIAEEVIAGLRV